MTHDDDKNGEPVPANAPTEGGVSSQDPAEGADETAPPTEGSPKG